MAVNMRRMNAVTVDADARRVRIEGSAFMQDVLDAAAPHGLAPMNGSTPTVSAIGFLGGGHSPPLAAHWAGQPNTSPASRW
jgi:FAD/FMN-containing dehydrogenase